MNQLARVNQPSESLVGAYGTENREAIRLYAPRLDFLLQTGKPLSSPSSIRRLDDGGLIVRSANESHRIIDPVPPDIPSDPEKPIMILGIGSGQTVNRYLSLVANPLLVIEPEVDLLGEVLKRYDWHRFIRNDQLQILAPDMKDPLLSQISLQECVSEIQQRIIDHDGNAYWVISGSFDVNRPFFDRLEKAISFFTDVSTFVADISDREQTPDEIGDVTVVSPECRIFDDMAHCFRQLGFKTQLWRVPDCPGKWSDGQWRDTYRRMRETPSKVFVFRNRSMLETETATDRYNWEYFMPGRVVSWWWDVPNVASRIDLAHPSAPQTHFAFARDIVDRLPGSAQWLPPGALTPFTARPISLTAPPKPDLPATFVGQSRMHLIISNLKILHEALRYFCGSEGSFLSADIQKRSNILDLHAYLHLKKREIDHLIKGIEPGRPHHAYYLDYIFQMVLTGLFRLAAVLTLKRASLPVMVFGDEGWVKTGVVDETAFKGLIAPENLPELYQRSAVNLNFNFMQVSSTVNPKVLDACAVGGTVLTDYRPELEWLFPDPQIRPFYFETLAELPQKLNALLRSDHTDHTEHRMKLLVYTRNMHSLKERARRMARILKI